MTPTTTHTPGPWRYEEETRTIRAVPSNYWLATMDSWDGAINNEANAALIAAAPTLLEAARRVDQWFDVIAQNYPEMIADFRPVRAAIDVAEGRTFEVKCDDCKVTIRMTASMQESAAGGRCPECAKRPGEPVRGRV